MDYKALEITNSPITIEVRASNGIVKTKTVSYESLATNFEVIFSPDTLTQLGSFNLKTTNFNLFI